MKPTDLTAIQVAEFLFSNFQPAEIIDGNTDEIIMHEAVIPVSVVISILKRFGFPEPDFAGWAQTMTNEKLKKSRIKYQVAQKILAAMKEKSITQRELAKKLNKTPGQINHLLSGENMTIETIDMFQQALGITLLDLS